MSSKFTQKAQNSLNSAITYAREFGHTYIGSEHLLLGLASEPDCRASKILSEKGANIDKLKKVSILGIKKIGDFAFANCKNLEIFHVENGDLQTSDYPYIGTNVCAGCEKLSRVAIYNFSLIGNAAFANCANLKSIKIQGGSGGHTSCIGKEAFKMCSSLKDIDLSEVGIISESAFSGCSSLENVKLGEPLNRIEKRVFDGCKNLKTIMLPNYFFEW